MERPLVSVIMPSYNADSNYLQEAVESVLSQTYTNFELIIIDDGSESAVKNVLSDIEDTRIIFIENPENKGLPYTLNNGIKHSNGKYIFRMDSDDHCVKERIQKEVAFFETHPDIDVVSSFAKTFGNQEILYCSSTKDAQIKAELLWKNPIVHPTAAFRTDTLRKHKIFYQEGVASEDFEIWSRMAFMENCHFAVIPEVLLNYRLHAGQVTTTKKENLVKSSKEILGRSFSLLGIMHRSEELESYSLMQIGEPLSVEQIKAAATLMKRIIEAEKPSIDNQTLRKTYRKALTKYAINEKSLYALMQAVVM